MCSASMLNYTRENLFIYNMKNKQGLHIGLSVFHVQPNSVITNPMAQPHLVVITEGRYRQNTNVSCFMFEILLIS